ncbi:GNAT family N-acetyltransferase [Chitinophaga barathri]|uniref:N-acetyltransferase n=1 Tax=Chitinophaga barathri TaxID=1647451 RepID=A0A3N4M4A9_9BACT|nr:GNAT family N-acetyltransferase [Chitinophaga barathri]RPD37872.1 N-acetyltransferase [Chitinophaga barathri]
MQRIIEARKEGFLISTDNSLLRIDVIHHYLSVESYWAEGIPRAIVERSIEGSLCFGLYAEDGQQIGFARVITDMATFAYLADVFVLDAWRKRGLSKWLMEVILAHPGLQDVRRMMLITMDAQGLYEQFGFAVWEFPERSMSKRIGKTYAEMNAAHS